ncbi:serine protease VLSP-3-like [Hippoglossus stenolepis]|uniref:serine protease VLSP-3-like n=1 Tax=Hippoglossus stenolepis TaxID=195615 RepID=UPI001FAF37EF|nr:serine protease VLSP-3-like [Hippoglossus stenolepis]
MLLKLPHTVVGITPVRAPDCQHPPRRGAVVQVAGHASTTVGPYNTRQPGSSATLQCADMDVIDCPYQQWICAFRHGVDICRGDSGGGVVYQGRIHGVIVLGHPTHACAAPARFMNLCHLPYLKWITDTIKPPGAASG